MIALWTALAFAAPAAPPAPLPPAAVTDAPAETPAMSAISASLVVKVGEVQPAADALVAKVKTFGGWFQRRTETEVAFRVPAAEVEHLIAEAAALGVVADRSFSERDLTPQVVDLRSRLAAREGVLDRYYALLETAKPASVVSVERQITNLIGEIEGYRGQLRVLEHNAVYASVTVQFSFRDRRAPARDGSSSFGWLNTLNLEDVVNDFRAPAPWWTTRATAAAPAGFSAWHDHRRFRAVSPDGVMYRVRTTRHKPAATLAFWKEALRERMEAAGYRVTSETERTAGGVAGSWLVLQAPLGTADYTYAVGVFPTPQQLILVEAAGEISDYAARADAIAAAVGQLAP